MPRTLSIFFPDGRTAFWLTTLVFEAGDTLNHGGSGWIVTSVGQPERDGEGRHTTVTVRAHADGDDKPSQDGCSAEAT